MAGNISGFEAENRLHEHNKELLREEFQHRTEARRADKALRVDLSITLAIVVEAIIALVHPVVPTRVPISLVGFLAVCAIALVIYILASGVPPESEWEEYERKREAEFQRHEEALGHL